MGHTWSRDGVHTSTSPTHNNNSNDNSSDGEAHSLPAYNLDKPRAAVVGGGMAGVHVAYELADLGFDVTLYEQHAQLACGGGTQHTLPFVGVGLLQPSLATARVRREWLWQLFASAWSPCPWLETRSHRVHALLQPHVQQWLRGRARGGGLSADEVLWYTNRLSHVSVSVLHALATAHPSLREHVYDGAIAVHSSKSNNNNGSHESKDDDSDSSKADEDTARALTRLVKTAHPSPLLLRDPVAWTRALAQLCVREHGLHLALGTRVERVHVHLQHDVEVARSLLVSRAVDEADAAASPSPQRRQGGRVYEECAYDLVVLACGADTARLSLPMTQLPLVDLAGCAVAILDEHAASSSSDGNKSSSSRMRLRQQLHRLFASTGTRHRQQAGTTATTAFTSISASNDTSNNADGLTTTAALVALASPCSLYAYSIPSHALPVSTSSTAATTTDGAALSSSSARAHLYMMSGLLSLDTLCVRYAPRARQLLERLEAYAQVWCDLDLPLCSTYDETTAAPSHEDSNKDTASEAALRMHASAYVRAFSADGAPLVDHCGSLYNAFVCCGFGDHTADMAPGAAKMLRALIERQTHRLAAEAALRAHAQPHTTPQEQLQQEQQRALSLRLLQRSEDDMRALASGQLPRTLTSEHSEAPRPSTTRCRDAYVRQRLARDTTVPLLMQLTEQATVATAAAASSGTTARTEGDTTRSDVCGARVRRLLPLPRRTRREAANIASDRSTVGTSCSGGDDNDDGVRPTSLLLNPFAASRFATSLSSSQQQQQRQKRCTCLYKDTTLASSSSATDVCAVHTPDATQRHYIRNTEQALLRGSTRLRRWLCRSVYAVANDERTPDGVRERLYTLARCLYDDDDGANAGDSDNRAEKTAQREAYDQYVASKLRVIAAQHERGAGDERVSDAMTALLAQSAQRQEALQQRAHKVAAL